jgi:hypothetical protein
VAKNGGVNDKSRGPGKHGHRPLLGARHGGEQPTAAAEVVAFNERAIARAPTK